MTSAIRAVTVRSGGVLLRPWVSADATQVARACADPLIVLWNAMNDASTAEWCAARADWSDGNHASWAIVEPTSPELVLGSVSLFHIDVDQGCAEIGYWVAPDHRRRAVAGRGVEAATTFAFGELLLRRVILFHAVENAWSCDVARRAGYLLEGCTGRRIDAGTGGGTTSTAMLACAKPESVDEGAC